MSYNGDRSAYTIVVVLSQGMLKEEKEKLEAALTAGLHNCVAGAFEIDGETWQSVTFRREAETDGPLIRKNFQGPQLLDVAQAARSQLAAEFEDTRPSNEQLIEIIGALKGINGLECSVTNVEGLTHFVAVDLQAARDLAAEAKFERYDFGEVGFQDCGGWERADGSNEMTRPCYITDDNAESDDAPSLKIYLTVRFAHLSAAVEEVYAIHNGNILGKRGDVPVEPAPQVQALEAVTATALVDVLAATEGPMSVNSGLLWLETGQSIDLAGVKASLQTTVAKAKALDKLLVTLTEAGFGNNESMNGGDCVELIDQLYKSLIKRFPQS
jgi:hypothetical protein